MNFETLLYVVDDRVATITLNRPDARNAINSVMSSELPAVWQHFENDDTALVAIITSAGEKAFCTGADLMDLPETDGEEVDGRKWGTLQSIRWTSLQNKVGKPVICAIGGMVVGGGLHFVADSDIVIASESASFLDTHVKVGLVAGLEPVSLLRRMPMGAVMKLMLTGGKYRMSAAEAAATGMIDEVVPADQLMTRARALADMIKDHSPAALARTKQAIWEANDMGLNEGLENAWKHIMAQNTHPDIEEGGRAFVEKRAPNWQPYSKKDD